MRSLVVLFVLTISVQLCSAGGCPPCKWQFTCSYDSAHNVYECLAPIEDDYFKHLPIPKSINRTLVCPIKDCVLKGCFCKEDGKTCKCGPKFL